MSKTKKILLTVFLGLLVLLGVYSLFQHIEFIIKNFIYDIDDPTFGGIYFDVYYRALASYILRTFYNLITILVFSFLVIKTWIPKKG